MADEPEDFSEAARNPHGQQPPARQERTYHLFLEELRRHSALPPDQVEKTLVRVLCVLQRHLMRGAEEDLRAPLPLRLQEALQACAPRHDHPSCQADLDGLLDQVARELSTTREQAESTVRAVLATVRAQLPEDEAEHVGHCLTLPFRALWARPI